MPEYSVHCHIRVGGEDYEVDAWVSEDPGVRTFRNGDPGYPPSTEITINEIKDEDGHSMEDKMLADEDFYDRVISAVEEKIGDE